MVRVDGTAMFEGYSDRIFAAESVGFDMHNLRILLSVVRDVTRGQPLRARNANRPVS